jgi:hypothetical protein
MLYIVLYIEYHTKTWQRWCVDFFCRLYHGHGDQLLDTDKYFKEVVLWTLERFSSSCLALLLSKPFQFCVSYILKSNKGSNPSLLHMLWRQVEMLSWFFVLCIAALQKHHRFLENDEKGSTNKQPNSNLTILCAIFLLIFKEILQKTKI